LNPNHVVLLGMIRQEKLLEAGTNLLIGQAAVVV
jgi:hypothetical protein